MKTNRILQNILISVLAGVILSSCNGKATQAEAKGLLVDYITVPTDLPNLLEGGDTELTINLNKKNSSISNDPIGKQYTVDTVVLDGNNNPTKDIIEIENHITLIRGGTGETKKIKVDAKKVGFGKITFQVEREDRKVEQKAYTAFNVVAK